MEAQLSRRTRRKAVMLEGLAGACKYDMRRLRSEFFEVGKVGAFLLGGIGWSFAGDDLKKG